MRLNHLHVIFIAIFSTLVLTLFATLTAIMVHKKVKKAAQNRLVTESAKNKLMKDKLAKAANTVRIAGNEEVQMSMTDTLE